MMKLEWIIAKSTEGHDVRLRLEEIAAYRVDEDACYVWMRQQPDDAAFALVPEVAIHLDAIFKPRNPKEVL